MLRGARMRFAIRQHGENLRRFVVGLAALSLALGIAAYLAGPVRAAVPNYDSAYFGESAFLTLSPGQSGQFAVGFNNTGSVGWVTGSASQVDLQVCLADKVTCGVSSPNAAWASNWLSTTAYATTTTSFVGPGQTGWFVYSIVAPASAAGQTARFNGDLALHVGNQQIHPQGYYQDAAVTAAPAALTITPASATATVGSTVQFSVTGATPGSTTAWAVNGGCGTITQDGLFTATTPVGPCSVVVTTSAGQSASASVSVVPGFGGGGGGSGQTATHLTCGAWTTNPIANNGTSTSSTTVSVRDVNGNVVSSGSFSVSFTRTSGSSTTLVTASPQSTSSGTATFTVRSTGTAGTDTYQASSSGLSSVTCPTISAQ